MNTFQCQKLDKFDLLTYSNALVGKNLIVIVRQKPDICLVFKSKEDIIKEIPIEFNLEIGKLAGNVASIFGSLSGTYICHFDSESETADFIKLVKSSVQSFRMQADASSDFDKRTDEWSAIQYFQFYSYLSQQQNMMQDYIRTSTYQKAIQLNSIADFRGKVVLDVGAGSGILSFFAAQAGAAKVYAVEASNMAKHCETLVQNNKMAGKIIVISGRIEDIDIPEPVDVIISEPMGYMLFNERMLETYVHARKFLNKKHRIPVLDKNGVPTEEISNTAVQSPGKMFPTVAHMYMAPFSDDALFTEQQTKANFWYQQSFHGMDLSSLRSEAFAEYFNQPIVDTFDIEICPALPVLHKVDFRTIEESELANIEIPLEFMIHTCSTIHGLAFWFDVGFLGTQKDVWLSTAPTEPLTHWYQVRCLIGSPLNVQQGQILRGMLRMTANKRQSYDVDIELIVPGTSTRIKNTLDLKNPYFRYTGYPSGPTPGSHSKPPTENYINNILKSQKPTICYEGENVNSTACGDNTLWPGGNAVSLKEFEATVNQLNKFQEIPKMNGDSLKIPPLSVYSPSSIEMNNGIPSSR